MARISTVLASSHSPFLYQPVEWWEQVRTRRSYAPGVPVDSMAENVAKMARIEAAHARLRAIYQAARPDVLVVFGDDQDEQFSFANHPAFAVYVGGTFGAYRSMGYAGPPDARVWKPRTPEHWVDIKTHAPLARAIMTGTMQAGFDAAFMLSLPNEELGIGHAFTRPVNQIDPEFSVPMVPILVNCFYAPQPSATRCVALARAVRDIILAWPEDLNVAVLGSGGLWHTPGAAEAYLDTEFDQTILDHLRAGDADAAADYFDHWQIPVARRDLQCFDSFAGGTGMTGGIGSGTGETRNWIMAAAVADRPATVIDYLPINASPCGVAFASWTMQD